MFQVVAVSDISQGSVATCLRCGGKLSYRRFTIAVGERLKIGEHLAMLDVKAPCHLSFPTRCIHRVK